MTDCQKCPACNKPVDAQDFDPDPHLSFRISTPSWLMNKYYLSVGKLLSSYSSVEIDLAINLQNLLQELVGFTPDFIEGAEEEGKKILMGYTDPAKAAGRSLLQTEVIIYLTEKLNITNYRDMIIRLMRMAGRKNEHIVEVQKIFAHIAAIGDIRNRIVHHGAYSDLRNKDGWFYTCNHYVKSKKKDSIYFKPEMLLAAARDLGVMPSRIEENIFPDEAAARRKSKDSTSVAYYNSTEYKAYIKDRDGPWHFNPNELNIKPFGVIN